MQKLQDIQRAMELLSACQGPARNIDEAAKHRYQFWDTQPVPKLSKPFCLFPPETKRSLWTKLVEMMEFQLSYFKSWKKMLWKCCTHMPANLENSAVATGLEKVSFHSNPKERQCQRMLKLPHNYECSGDGKADPLPGETRLFIGCLWLSDSTMTLTNLDFMAGSLGHLLFSSLLSQICFMTWSISHHS